MTNKRRPKALLALAARMTGIGVLLICGITAQGQNTQGVITGRSGATMTIQTQDASKVTVLLTPATDVDEAQGVFGRRGKQMAMTCLIPGLPVQLRSILLGAFAVAVLAV